MQTRLGLAASLSCLMFSGLAMPLAAETPLSAIDWLSESVASPSGTTVTGGSTQIPTTQQPGVTIGAVPDDVAVSVIGAPSLDAIGLLTPDVTHFPKKLWGDLARTKEIAATITTEQPSTLPALQLLMLRLMLAEADPPADSDGSGSLLMARIDKLLAIGALEQAQTLLAVAGDGSTELFRRSFDVSLLLGSEDTACTKMQEVPKLAPTFMARIFCLARAGDWNTAALSLSTGRALGRLDADEEALMIRFLDPEQADGAEPLPVPEKPTPLVLRIYEAIGEPISTLGLPVAFAYVDMESRSGWKAQLEAAERLSRVGAIGPNALLGIYTEREPAASGGVWDRVRAFQDFDDALRAQDVEAVSRTLPIAWIKMTEAELEVPFAQLFAKDLSRLKLQGAVEALSFRISLLSDDFEAAARARTPKDAGEAFLVGVALGNLNGVTPPDALSRAIAPAFVQPDPSQEARSLMEQSRTGEALLFAIEKVQTGSTGDLADVTEGLSVLRMLKLEDVARKAALELMLLERRG